MKIFAPEMLVATRNQGKIREFKDLLNDKIVVWRSLADFPRVREVAETGRTFAENADLKARGYALETNLLTLADDSGLEVAALGGAPGVFSARYGGKGLTDAERAEKLLMELAAIEKKDRRAQFVCVISVATRTGEIIHQTTGICCGKISLTPLGSNGFGYDPVFVPDGYEQTFAQLPPEIKNKISHRAQAAQRISRFLRDFLNVSLDQANQHR